MYIFPWDQGTDLFNLRANFGIPKVVPQFCQANDLFVIEQARRLEGAGLSRFVTINTLKVGIVRTGVRREFPGWMKLLPWRGTHSSPERSTSPTTVLLAGVISFR